MAETKTMTAAQRAYEEKRAKKAGMTLDRWLATKEAERVAEARAAAPPPPPKPEKKPGFFGRLLERAQKPL